MLSVLHPESLPFFGDVNSQYDVWSGKRHISRMINPSGRAQPASGNKMTPERHAGGGCQIRSVRRWTAFCGETPRQRIVARLARALWR